MTTKQDEQNTHRFNNDTNLVRKEQTITKRSKKTCKKQACAIQYCLARNNYQENKCRDTIHEWELCVKKHSLSL